MASIGLYKPIKLLKYTVSVDGSGDNTESVEASYRLWADVQDGGGSRGVNRGQVDLNHSRTFYIFFRDGYGFTGDWRIKYNGKEYAISNVELINEKRFNLRITANTK